MKLLTTISAAIMLCATSAHAMSKEDAAFMNRSLHDYREMLNDPDSAKFKNVFIHNGSIEGKVICGEVNAKNAFGGYAGYHLFIAMPGGGTDLDPPEDASPEAQHIWDITQGETWKKYCVD